MAATTEQALAPVPQIVARRVEPQRTGWTSWVTTTDHKRIGIMYLVLTFVFFILGGTEALLMRLQLSQANNTLLDPKTYNELFTMHGTTMIFLFVVPVMAGFANYLIPLMIGARDMAFPKLNALSFWLLLAGGIVFYGSVFFNPPECGWTCYPPLASKSYLPNGGVDAWIFLIHLTGISSLIGAINLYATIANMRAPGMGWGRLPLFVWTILTYAILLILALPVIAGAVTMLLTDRHFGTHFFDASNGGSPLLWQHLFWFFGHPEGYIAILPGMGATSHILSTFARKPVFGYRAMVFAIFAIGLLGFFVWGHHMFISGMSPYSAMTFSILTLSIGVPSAVKTFNWLGTLWGGKIRFTTPMLFAIGFVSLFVAGGITGLVLGQTSLDLPMHDTYFVLAHFHLVMGVASIFGMFAATYFWFPKMFGRFMNETLGKIHFWITFVGVYCIFVPMHTMGIVGMPRRYAQFTEYEFLKTLHPLVVFVSVVAIITVLTQILFYVNLIWSIFKGKEAGENPWEATTLEWTTPSPPPHDNFAGIIPTVYRGPYEFAVPGAPNDFLMQTESGAEVTSGNGHEGHKH